MSLGSRAASRMDRSETGHLQGGGHVVSRAKPESKNQWECSSFETNKYTLATNKRLQLFAECAWQTTECTTAGSLTLWRKYTPLSLRASSQPSGSVPRRAFALRSGRRPQSRLGTKATGRGSCRHQQERATPKGSPEADLETPVRYARVVHLQSFWRHRPSCVSSIIPPCLKLFKIHTQDDDDTHT